MTPTMWYLVGAVAFAALVGGVAFLFKSPKPKPAAPKLPGADPNLEVAPQLQTLLQSGGNQNIRVMGDMRFEGRASVPEGLVVEGSLALADGCELDALVVVHGNVTMGAKSHLRKPLVVHGDLTMGRDTRIPGCHVSGDAAMHLGATIDTALTCRTLYLEETSESAAAK